MRPKAAASSSFVSLNIETRERDDDGLCIFSDTADTIHAALELSKEVPGARMGAVNLTTACDPKQS